ncbi:MAG: hypothetical protein IT170_15935 [Bryobacterales bacterium]|nr:hypothetical protein [Bryobacterales bacterium]
MLAFLLLALTVNASFESGSLKSSEVKSPTHVVATIQGQADAAGRNYQPSWFYFSIGGLEDPAVKGREVTVDLAGLEGEYNFQPHDGSGDRNVHPAYSYDNLHWRYFDKTEWLEKPSRIRVKFKPEGERIWIARTPPYTLAQLDSLLRSIEGRRWVTVREFGRSVQGRPLQQITITDPGVPVEKKKTVWILARQHAWESDTSWVFEGAARFLSGADPAAADLRRRYVFQMMPTLDPDGIAAGGVRFNRNGYDLNRNWDVEDARLMPEIAATRKAVESWIAEGHSIDFFLTIHNTESADFLSGPVGAHGSHAKEIGERLNALLKSATHFSPTGGVRDSAAGEKAPGRLTVDRWVFEKTGAPSFLMELMTNPSPAFGRPALTSDRLNFGGALVRLIDEALTNAPASSSHYSTPMRERLNAYEGTLERWLQDDIVNGYAARQAKLWHRDYSSVEAYLKSVEPNRERYRAMFAIPGVKPTGAPHRRPFTRISGIRAEWVTVPLSGGITAEGLLAMPASASGKVPLIIAQHGIDSYPERVFGLEDESGVYKAYGRALVEQGFAVLAPMNLSSIERRNRVERLARLDGTSLAGIEFERMKLLLDTVLEDPTIDQNRIGFWGISLGGMAGMYWTPLEPRIKASIITAWFNHRRNKMAIPDTRYSVFLDTTEEYVFLRGWLTEFTDSDVASLICPRPLMVQHGKKDGIAYWPQVEEEFRAAQSHYEKLGFGDRAELVMHEGRHEIELPSGLAFLKRWLGANSGK